VWSKALIRYGRLSSTKTYTMTFAMSGIEGTALVVPCQAEGAFDVLRQEAEELWAAEINAAGPNGTICNDWGCVGGLFPPGAPLADVSTWSAIFRGRGGKAMAAVDEQGLLKIPWPQRLDGQALDCDVLLATSNVEKPAASPEQIAEAWINKGDGEYFFENVKAGIRTSDDERIWRRLAHESGWLSRHESKHVVAISKLRQEFAGT
jgi:hypothetical protein